MKRSKRAQRDRHGRLNRSTLFAQRRQEQRELSAIDSVVDAHLVAWNVKQLSKRGAA